MDVSLLLDATDSNLLRFCQGPDLSGTKPARTALEGKHGTPAMSNDVAAWFSESTCGSPLGSVSSSTCKQHRLSFCGRSSNSSQGRQHLNLSLAGIEQV